MPEKPEIVAKWQQHLDDQRESGLTLAEYARTHGLIRGTLSHWKWKLSHPEARDRPRARRIRRAAPKAAPLQFLEVRAPASAERYELELTDGRRLRIPPGFEAQALQRLLGVLEVQP